jgi:prepilin-type processing-associated H-X9-DG protein
VHPSARYVFVEENDPRGENEGSWDQGSEPQEEDSAASWHGYLSTFSFADGHVQKHGWMDPIFIAYAQNMNPGKYQGVGGTIPTADNSPHDCPWLFAGFANAGNP